jgi:hypothetical protein
LHDIRECRIDLAIGAGVKDFDLQTLAYVRGKGIGTGDCNELLFLPFWSRAEPSLPPSARTTDAR